MQFETWLRKQQHKDTAIGDLARDWIDDGCPKPFDLEYLELKNACNDAIKVYKSALRKYIEDVYLTSS